MIAGLSPRVLAIAAGAAMASASFAQTSPAPSRQVPWHTDSGMVTPVRGAAGYTVVYATTVFVPQAPWLRLSFGASTLPGAVEEGRGSYLRLTSLHDGAVQYLNSESIAQWANTSAYFNGDAVRVELLAYPGTGASRISIRTVTAGEGSPADTICGPVDDRTLIQDARGARHLPEGCSTWLFNDINRTFMTAGHCGVSTGDVQQFNVPPSNSNGSLVNPPPEDQYSVDGASVQATSGAIGSDAGYFACFVNSNTGLTAFQKQQQHYTLRSSTPAFNGGLEQNIRITGFGSASGIMNQAQKTHVGPYWSFSGSTVRYQTDTTGGNSGSAVLYENDGTVIGIHTHGGCTSSPGTSSNAGTALNFASWQAYLAAPRTLCLTGKGAVTPPLYAVGDGQNNFGTLNTVTGNFAKVAFAPVRMEGMAYNRNSGLFYGINNDTYPATAGKRLYTIHPATGAVTTLGLVTGIADPINGLGYDPTANILYGVAQATGQLVTINTSTRVATPIGPANVGRTIGALEYSPTDNALYGIDDGGGASKLVKWNDPTQSATQIGLLGAGIADCNGLGVTDNGDLWTINAGNEQLLRINRTTGIATVIGGTGGIFGASYGISAVLAGGPAPCYANCDGIGGLTANDFQCFANAFAGGQSYADCDGVGGLTANDFSCFLNAYAQGCS
jgi:V8-like Glu-specific endopeptidase